MTRFFLALFGTLMLVLLILAMIFFKDSYKVLPLQGSDPSGVSKFADWREFKAPQGTFQAKFPTVPQHASQSVRDPKTQQLREYEMYVGEEGNGSIFMVSVIDFPNSKENPETLKKTIMNDLLVSNPQNQLKSMKVGTYKLFSTVDFVITGPDKTINGRVFSDGNNLYLLTGIFNNAYVELNEYEYFINSFEWMTPR